MDILLCEKATLAGEFMSSEPVVPVGRVDSVTETSTRPGHIAGELPIASDVTVPQPELTPGSPLRGTAQSVGTAFGKAVAKARGVPSRMAELRQRFTVIRGKAREDTASAAQDIRQNARQKLTSVRTRAQYYAHEHPLEFIVAAGGVGVVLGFALRIWRSSRRDERYKR
jgi:ElaB/YqjD/DUF883 family membrane-anchored ribosome-binding protein